MIWFLPSLLTVIVQGVCTNYNVTPSAVGVLPPCYLASVSYPTAGVNVFESYSFTTSVNGSWLIGFTFRQDPGYWTFTHPSLVANGSSHQLLQNADLSAGGNVLVNGAAVNAPNNFLVWYQTGAPPQAAGTWSSGQWYDGAVGSFDGIYQSMFLNKSTTYVISFDITGTQASDGNGIQLGVYALPCADTTASPAQCLPPASLGFGVAIPDSPSVSISVSGSVSISSSNSLSNSKSASVSVSFSLTRSPVTPPTLSRTGTMSYTGTSTRTDTLTGTMTMTDTLTGTMTMTDTLTGTTTMTDTLTGTGTMTDTMTTTGTSTSSATSSDTNTGSSTRSGSPTTTISSSISPSRAVALGVASGLIVSGVAVGAICAVLVVTAIMTTLHAMRRNKKDPDDEKRAEKPKLLINNLYRGPILPVTAPQTNHICEHIAKRRELAKPQPREQQQTDKIKLEFDLKDLAEIKQILKKSNLQHKVVG